MVGEDGVERVIDGGMKDGILVIVKAGKGGLVVVMLETSFSKLGRGNCVPVRTITVPCSGDERVDEVEESLSQRLLEVMKLIDIFERLLRMELSSVSGDLRVVSSGLLGGVVAQSISSVSVEDGEKEQSWFRRSVVTLELSAIMMAIVANVEKTKV